MYVNDTASVFAFTGFDMYAWLLSFACVALTCSDPDCGSSVRIECIIEGTTSPGRTEAVMESVNEIVTKTEFYIPGTNTLSGKYTGKDRSRDFLFLLL